MKEEIKL